MSESTCLASVAITTRPYADACAGLNVITTERTPIAMARKVRQTALHTHTYTLHTSTGLPLKPSVGLLCFLKRFNHLETNTIYNRPGLERGFNGPLGTFRGHQTTPLSAEGKLQLS